MKKYIACCISMLALILMQSLCFSENLEKGKSIFAQRCASCHGNLGAGDGPVAAALPPDQKPASFVAGVYKFVTNLDKFKELMKKGGAGVGLNPLMPPAADLTDEDTTSLYAYVQSLKK